MCDLEGPIDTLESKLDALQFDLAELKRMVSRHPTVRTLVLVNVGLAVTVPALVLAIAQVMR